MHLFSSKRKNILIFYLHFYEKYLHYAMLTNKKLR